MTDTGRHPRKSYDEGCIAAHALDLVGDRWALLVVRELMLGPKRFGAIRAGLPGISANILTRRLDDLLAAGVIRRRQLPPPAPVQVYDLTADGHRLRPVIESLCRWGAAMPGHDPGLFISPTALMVSMGAMIDHRAAKALELSAGFDLGEECFDAHLDRGRLVARPVATPAGDLVFRGTTNAVASAVYARRPLAETLARGAVTVEGDPVLAQRFVDLFDLRRD